MKPNKTFRTQPKEFWANVRTLSQEIGYTRRRTGTILVPTVAEMAGAFAALQLSPSKMLNSDRTPTELGELVLGYFEYRAMVLNTQVERLLMKKQAAEALFNELRANLKPRCPLPLNKQKGDKKNFAFLTGIANMLIEANIGNSPCDYDPRSLTTVTKANMPLRTLARRVDGAFPSVVDPVAIWEIKEYYYTTTFGSRVADGVYETLLDGMELQELEAAEGRTIEHLLIVDDYFTWWECGRSYLCRIIDMLHMGYVDEVLFGREVVDRLPSIAAKWKVRYDELRQAGLPAG